MASASKPSATLKVEQAGRAKRPSKKAAIKAHLKQLLDRQPVRDEEDACFIRSYNWLG